MLGLARPSGSSAFSNGGEQGGSLRRLELSAQHRVDRGCAGNPETQAHRSNEEGGSEREWPKKTT